MSFVQLENDFAAVYLFCHSSPHVGIVTHPLSDICSHTCVLQAYNKTSVTLGYATLIFPTSWRYKSFLMYDRDNRRRACIIYTWPVEISALVRSWCVGSAALLFILQHSEQESGWRIMNNPHNKCSEHPVVVFWCGNAHIHSLITVHTRKWVLTIPLHLAVLSCFHLLWITWLRAPLRPTGAENRSDLLFNSVGETVNIFLHLHLGEEILTTWKQEKKVTLRFINISNSKGGWKSVNINMNLIVCLKSPLSQCPSASLIHLQLYFESPFISNHQFMLFAGKITTSEKNKTQPLVFLFWSCVNCAQTIVDKTIHFLLPFPLKFSAHGRDACDLEEEGSCLPERSADLLTSMY